MCHSYHASTVCNEFIEHLSVQEIQLTQIISEVKDRNYYSISVDSTPNIAHTDQLTIIIVKPVVPLRRGSGRVDRYFFPSFSVSAQLQINRSSLFVDAVLPSLCRSSSRRFSLFFSVCCPLNHFVVLTPSDMSVPPQSAFLHLTSPLHHTNIPSHLLIHHPVPPGDTSYRSQALHLRHFQLA